MVLMKLTLKFYISHLHTLKGLCTSQLLLYQTIFEQNSLLFVMCALTKIPVVCKVYLLCVVHVSCDKSIVAILYRCDLIYILTKLNILIQHAENMDHWRVNNWVRVCYRVIWNRVQLFGDYNTRVRVAHVCVIIIKKLHSIPYDTLTHWNGVINPYLHRQLTCSFSTFFPHERQWQWKRKCSRRGDFPRHIPSWLELNIQKIYCSAA